MECDRELVRFGARCELARRHFYDYCKLFSPDFYRDDRPYIKRLCDSLEGFLSGPERVLIVNAPPRHGKSRTVGKLIEWVFGKDPKKKVMTCSYNETLSTDFSKTVRDTIMERKADLLRPVYADVFPKTKIKRGDAAANLWSLVGGHASYLATSPGGTATGFGADILIVDDLIKNEYEARNAAIKKAHWAWFTRTMTSRTEAGCKVIIIMTRWASDDLAGNALDYFAKEKAWPLKHICLKALQEDGTMLCEEVLSRSDYEVKARAMGADIAAANYQQEPIDLKGQLYTHLMTYEKLPADANGRPLFTAVKSYTDTADTGSDYLCHICYGIYQGIAYVLDVLYTQEPMEKTEPAAARMTAKNGVREARIESNNGGRGFARSVKKHLAAMGYACTVIPFTQGKNKQARILTGATLVMSAMRFPVDWETRWPEYAEAMKRYQREGKNAHDDAPDATTGVVEWMQSAGVRGVTGSL